MSAENPNHDIPIFIQTSFPEQPELDQWKQIDEREAKLVYDDGESVQMTPGDHVLISAHRKHRVEWTTPDEPTVWLAVFYRD